MLEEIFTINVSHKNIRLLRRVKAIALFLMIAALLASVSEIWLYFPTFKQFLQGDVNYSGSERLTEFASFIYTSVFAIIFPIQAYYFLRFCRLFNKAVVSLEQHVFTRSLKALSIYCLCCIVTYTLNVAVFVLALYLKYF